MMKLASLMIVAPLVADAAKVATRSRIALREEDNPCPNGLENRFPKSLEKTYTIAKEHGLNPLDAIWDTEKLREAMKEDKEWKIGMQWMLKAKFSSDSSVDRTFGFAGPNGGFLTVTVPKGVQGKVVEVTGVVGAASDKLEFQYLKPADWTSGTIEMTDICLTPKSCDNFECPVHSKRKGKGLFGNSEARCCQQKLCEEEKVECPEGKYSKHANYSNGKAGFDEKTCCTPIFCPVNLCENETKWSDKGDKGLVGSTPEDCCEERLCATHTCAEGKGKSRKLDIWESEGVARKGSTDAECCEPIWCKDFVCLPKEKYGNKPWALALKGSDRDTCCDVLKCDTFECPNNTKWAPKPNAIVGNSKEECCEKKTCDTYTCSAESLQLLVNPSQRLGSTDEECCEQKSCLQFKCSDATKWVHRADQKADTNTDRKGWSDEECCEKLICLPEICDPATQWKAKENDGSLQGSTFEQCCDRIFCEDFVCDTDVNKTGKGTQWYKKVDTNHYKWQGSTSEECCEPNYCSQYETSLPTRWKRKSDKAALGSTDVECYDPKWCSDYCCADDSKMLMPNAEKKQGSTDQECCIDKAVR